jgi:hypothetical protein
MSALLRQHNGLNHRFRQFVAAVGRSQARLPLICLMFRQASAYLIDFSENNKLLNRLKGNKSQFCSDLYTNR